MRSLRRPQLVWVLLALFLLVVGVWGSWKLLFTARTVEPGRILAGYFRALVTAELDDPGAYLAGTALTNARRSAGSLPAAATLDTLDISWAVVGPQVAVADVEVTIHQVSSGGRLSDVQAIRAHLAHLPVGWRIVALEPAPLPYGGTALDTTTAQSVVSAYVTDVISGRYDQALTHLAGRARMDAEATLEVVKQGHLEARVSDIQTSVLQTQGDAAWIQAEYQITMAELPERTVTILCELRRVGDRVAIVKVTTI